MQQAESTHFRFRPFLLEYDKYRDLKEVLVLDKPPIRAILGIHIARFGDDMCASDSPALGVNIG